jgi:hypothetical protein
MADEGDELFQSMPRPAAASNAFDMATFANVSHNEARAAPRAMQNLR